MAVGVKNSPLHFAAVFPPAEQVALFRWAASSLIERQALPSNTVTALLPLPITLGVQL